MQYQTKRGALAGCAVGVLVGVGIIGIGAYGSGEEGRAYEGYTAAAEGRVTRASRTYQQVHYVNGSPVEENPLYSTVAAFEVNGKDYQAKGETTCGWFVPGEGDQV